MSHLSQSSRFPHDPALLFVIGLFFSLGGIASGLFIIEHVLLGHGVPGASLGDLIAIVGWTIAAVIVVPFLVRLRRIAGDQ